MKRIAVLTLLVLVSFICTQAQITSRTAFGVRSVATLPATCVYNLVGRVDEVYKTGASAGFYTCNSSGNGWNGPYPTSGSGGGTPGGSPGQVQFNDAGVLGGNAGFVFDKTTGNLSVGGASQNTDNLLSLSNISTNTAGDVKAVDLQFAFNPVADESDGDTVIGLNFQVNIPGTNAQNLADFTGLQGRVNIGGSGTSSGGKGLYSNVALFDSRSAISTFGFWGYPANNTGSGTLTNGYGVYVHAPANTGGGVVTNNFAYWAEDQTLAGANTYYEWFDSQGVRRVKEDATFNAVGQAIEALYNPQFTKYTPGAANFERVILGQWNSNVAEIGNQAGGTGVLRNLRLLGAAVEVPSLTASQAVFTDASKNLVSVATTGTGNAVRASSPSLTTPNLGTPSAINLTNATAVPACATCVTSAASLTNTALVTGAGSQGSQTPNGSATLNASGDISLPGKLSTGVGGSVAGLIGVSQGTAQSVIANTVGLTAPTSVTGYNILYPAAAATGIGHYANSSNTVTMSISAVVESDITLADNTTNNSSISNHGFLKKLDNNAAHYMDGTGNWGTPGGSGTVNSGSQYQIGYYATTGTAISGDANLTTDASNSLIVGTSPDVGICRSAAGVLGVNDGSGTCTNYATAKGVAFIVTDFTNTTAGTTGAQTINKRAGSVNFAAAATSLVITNSAVATTSIIQCTVGTNDTTMKSVQCVAGSGSLTMYANAAATAETRVYFTIIN